MEEFEKFHFRQDFTQSFGLWRTVGALYQAKRLTQAQISALVALDRKALNLSADLETVYEVSLRQLLDQFFRWGTPLPEQTTPLQITTTIPALLELIQISPTPQVDHRMIA